MSAEQILKDAAVLVLREAMREVIPLVTPDQPRLKSRQAAARYLGVSPRTFSELVAEGSIPEGIRFGARRDPMWDVKDLDAAVEKRKPAKESGAA